LRSEIGLKPARGDDVVDLVAAVAMGVQKRLDVAS
jgi:hypothetical protein